MAMGSLRRTVLLVVLPFLHYVQACLGGKKIKIRELFLYIQTAGKLQAVRLIVVEQHPVVVVFPAVDTC